MTTAVKARVKALSVPAVNPSGIAPTEFNVLVRPREVETKTKGGILIPEIAREQQQAAATEGEIVAVSPLAFTYETWPLHARKPREGDRVLFGRYSGMTATGADGVEYRIIKDKDIAAVMEARHG